MKLKYTLEKTDEATIMNNQETLVAFGTQVTERRKIKQIHNTASTES
jgi:hypothetical protein